MAVKPTATVNPGRRSPRGFMNSLSYMVFEWLLIFLLFVDAALSYLLTKLARHCELQTPCLLCSRLDHVIGNEKPGFYRSLLCSNHRMEISSLISCHIHGKLADARGMCEECLMSFAIKNTSNSESHRLLVGKLGVNLDQCDFQSPFLNKNMNSGSLNTWTCSCCNKSWRARPNTQRLLQLPPGFGTLKTNAKPPLPRLASRGRFNRRDSFKKIRDKISGPMPPRRLGNTGVDPLSRVGYTELKIHSDTESEFPFSDEDDRSSVREFSDHKEVLHVQRSSRILPRARAINLAPVKQTQQASDPGPSLLDQCIQLDVREPRDMECLASDDVIGHGLGELNWEQTNPKPYPSAMPELILLDDVSPSSNVVDVPGGVSTSKSDGPLPHNSNLLMLSELVLPNDVPPASSVLAIPVGVISGKLDVIGTGDIGHKSVIKHFEVSTVMNSTTREGFKTDQALNDNAPSTSSNLGPSDQRKLSDSEGREVNGIIAELSARSNSAKVHDQKICVHEIGPSLDGTSPGLHDQHDELHKNDDSSSNGNRVLLKLPSLERNDYGYESLDGINVSDIEGESIVDRLKRQVEYDRRCMSSLYKELEEERNASEVAANQAMAMITRLQEEKASLHMEALQYLRMMEEQAEYDMEALEKANDLLAEKEKEVQDLEADLEFYRINYSDESKVGSLHGETSDSKVDNTRFDNNGVSQIKSKAIIPCDSMSLKVSEGNDKHNSTRTSLLDLEGEKLYISQCLKKLERKLHQVSGNGECSQAVEKVKNPTKFLAHGETQTDHQSEENGLLTSKDLSALNARLSTAEGSDVSIEDISRGIKENSHIDSDRRESSIHGREIDLVAVENEISELNGRLEAIEADRDLLKHALNSLRKGTDGLQFIQEIAHQLQELRKIQIEKRCASVP